MSSEWPILVPKDLGTKMLLNFFKGWDWKDDPASPVIIDFEQAEHIAPWAVCQFAAYILWLRKVRKKEVSVVIDENTVAGRYLIQCGFHELLDINVSASYPQQSERISPLVVISESSQIPTIAASMMQLLAVDDDEMAGAIQYSIVELLRNVVQHSRSKIGGVCVGTYYPGAEMAELVIADIGCGIKSSLRNRYPEINQDIIAVNFAVRPHVSSTFSDGAYNTMDNNAGLGLFFIKEIVSRGYGSLFLGSGNALADFWGNADGSSGKTYETSRTGGWRGTFAVLQFRRNMINEFDMLLQKCRELAADERKQSVNLKLDFIDVVPEIEELLVVKVSEFEENVERAAEIRDSTVIPALNNGQLVVIDFSNIRFATQSFVHACMYKILRDVPNANSCLSIVCTSRATREAIEVVATYASHRIDI